MSSMDLLDRIIQIENFDAIIADLRAGVAYWKEHSETNSQRADCWKNAEEVVRRDLAEMTTRAKTMGECSNAWAEQCRIAEARLAEMTTRAEAAEEADRDLLRRCEVGEAQLAIVTAERDRAYDVIKTARKIDLIIALGANPARLREELASALRAFDAATPVSAPERPRIDADGVIRDLQGKIAKLSAELRSVKRRSDSCATRMKERIARYLDDDGLSSLAASVRRDVPLVTDAATPVEGKPEGSHAVSDVGECASWCEQCRVERQRREAATKPPDERMRRNAVPATDQTRYHWPPAVELANEAIRRESGERPSSEFSSAEITIARAAGRLRVDGDGLGWVAPYVAAPGPEHFANIDAARKAESDEQASARVLEARREGGEVDSKATGVDESGHHTEPGELRDVRGEAAKEKLPPWRYDVTGREIKAGDMVESGQFDGAHRVTNISPDGFLIPSASPLQVAWANALMSDGAPHLRIVDPPAKTSTEELCRWCERPLSAHHGSGDNPRLCTPLGALSFESAPSAPAVPAHVAGGESDELFIWEEKEQHGGGHRKHLIEHATREREWSEPYKKTSDVEYRSRVVAYVPRSTTTVTINGEAMSTAEALRISQDNTRHAQEEVERLRMEVTALRARETDVAERQREACAKDVIEKQQENNALFESVVRATRLVTAP